MSPLGTVAGHVVDRVCGEPPNELHPLIAVGNGLTWLERRTYRDTRGAGVAHVGIALGAAAAVGLGLRRVGGPFVSSMATAAICTGGSMLWDAATTIGESLDDGDLAEAREQLPMLVGRDPSRLGESEIARAVIESVAENTVDAVTATLWWGLVGGAPMIAVHRVTNTLDAMVGHRNERYQQFGWASAKIDDALNWVPARFTAFAIAIAAPAPTKHVIDIVRRDGSDHPSPNGGQVEAAMAGALDITLGGPNDYGCVIEVRGSLGDGPAPTAADIAPAVELASRASWIAATTCGLIGLLRSCTRGRSL